MTQDQRRRVYIALDELRMAQVHVLLALARLDDDQVTKELETAGKFSLSARVLLREVQEDVACET